MVSCRDVCSGIEGIHVVIVNGTGVTCSFFVVYTFKTILNDYEMDITNDFDAR